MFFKYYFFTYHIPQVFKQLNYIRLTCGKHVVGVFRGWQ